ncbi:response regulator transcription factor [Pedobacter kyungheensis]|uniref:response regulator transcription factor n=1 Tax=Pedobacter kyungheensis TaxID=1069985 RepID=UPI00068BF094|nr:response regulator transcription factor [Pedobacter kyungheensis]
MKLDYKILWLDDKMDVINEGQYDVEIKNHLLENGFNPIIDTVNNEADFFRYLDDSYDLILTDYHLNETDKKTRDGDLIIKEIREENSIFTEIMFYSAQGEVVDTVKLDRITFVDTRKSTIRNHNEAVVDRAIKLIDLTIRKFQNIVAMRGMIMNETSSLDLQMLEIIKLSLSISEINFDELASEIYTELIQLYEMKSSFVNTCREKNKFNALTKDNFVFSAEYKIQTLAQILKAVGLEDYSEKYKEEINSMRNKFAHAVLMKDDNGREYFKHGETGLTFNEELCKTIRENIIQHKKNLNNTYNKLSSMLVS